MTVIDDINNEIFMLQNLCEACSNVFAVVKRLLIAKHKKERDAIIRFLLYYGLLLESNKKISRKKQRNDPMFWVRPGRTSI